MPPSSAQISTGWVHLVVHLVVHRGILVVHLAVHLVVHLVVHRGTLVVHLGKLVVPSLASFGPQADSQLFLCGPCG